MSANEPSRTDIPPPDYSGIREARQARSRETVEKIKAACAQLLSVENSVSDLNMRAIAKIAGVSGPAAYQYFDDVESVVMALLHDWAGDAYERSTRRAPEETPEEPEMTVREIIEDAFGMNVDYFRDWPHLVEVIHRNPRFFPRVEAAVEYFNLASASDMRNAMWNLGVVGEEFTLERSLFAVEMICRMWQLAYAHSNEPDLDVVAEGTVMLINYILQYARHPHLG